MDLLTRANERLVHYVHYVQDGSRSLHGRPGSGISVVPGPGGYCLCPGPPSPHSSSALPHALRPYAPQAWAGDLCNRGDDGRSARADHPLSALHLSLIHISEPTRRTPISYAVFCLKKKKKNNKD